MTQSGGTDIRKWTRGAPLFAVLLLLFSAAPYIVRPVWFDESLTLDWLTRPVERIPFLYSIPNNHIVYTVCLSLWDSLFRACGMNGVVFLRILSLAFASAALWIVMKRMLRAGGLFPALTCGILLAGSGAFRLYSTALRGYMPGLLFAFAAFLCAEKWMKTRKKRFFAEYLLFVLLAVGTIPTNLFAVGAGLLFLLPIGLRSKKDFARLVGAGLCACASIPVFYGHIWTKFLRASRLVEGWSSEGDSIWNLYGSWMFFLFPVLIFCGWGALRLWREHRRIRLRLTVVLLVLLLPLPLGLLFRAPPFPRVFFPFFGIWILGAAYLLSGFCGGGRRGRKWRKILPLILAVLWACVSQEVSAKASEVLFGGCFRDDLIEPYPMSVRFAPHKTAKRLAEAYAAGETEYVFADFDADPPSLIFALANLGVPGTFVLNDRPDLGRVIRLSPGVWIVCRDGEALDRLRKRFSLPGEYRVLDIGSPSLQRIYIPCNGVF